MQAIENEANVHFVEYTTPFISTCRLVGDRIEGDITIAYEPSEWLLELTSVEDWVVDLLEKKIIVEEVARLTFDAATRALGDIPLIVSVVGRTPAHAPVRAIVRREIQL